MSKKRLSIEEQRKLVEDENEVNEEDDAMEEVRPAMAPVDDDSVVELPKEAPLEKAIRKLEVKPIPAGVTSINELNYQVQVLKLRVKALEGKL